MEDRQSAEGGTGTEEGYSTGAGRPGKSRHRKKHGNMAGRAGPLLPVIVGIMILTGTALVCYFRYSDMPAAIRAEIDIRPDERAVDGSLHGSGGEPVPEGEYLVMVNQLPTIKEGSRECNIEFENPAGNHYSARINLYLNSGGKLLGGTRRVDPGQYVETIELNRDLKSGEYPVLARIELFTGTTPAGSLSLEMTLRVIE